MTGDNDLKIFPQKTTDFNELINLLRNNEGVCRTALATPGLLKVDPL